MRVRFFAIATAAILFAACRSTATHERSSWPDIPVSQASGPLHRLPAVSTYFVDATARPVFLTGSHTWNNFQDWGASDPPPRFDYAAYLSFLNEHSHNFFRLYVWEQAAWVPWSSEKVLFDPMPYLRTGPGLALDGRPKFDLTRFNQAYFDRVRQRVDEARKRGVYVAVMLFNGWSIDSKPGGVAREIRAADIGNPWRGHPFNRENNINGIDGDADHDGQGTETHTLKDPAVLSIQKAYVRKVIDSVGDLDNVVWEISNESTGGSEDWEYEMIRFIKSVESARPKQHPIGMTAEYPHGKNSTLYASEADWISPAGTTSEPFGTAPPVNSRRKVVISDTDHIWGIGGTVDWVWKSFTRGEQPIFMDPYQTELIGPYPMYGRQARRRPTSDRDWELLRANMGCARKLASRLDLASMHPRPEFASTRYCLAQPGEQYVIYVPRPAGMSRFFPADLTVDLSAGSGEYCVEWFDPSECRVVRGGNIQGGRPVTLTAPFTGAAVVYIAHVNQQPA